jgi:hypothetical protein
VLVVVGKERQAIAIWHKAQTATDSDRVVDVGTTTVPLAEERVLVSRDCGRKGAVGERRRGVACLVQLDDIVPVSRDAIATKFATPRPR